MIGLLVLALLLAACGAGPAAPPTPTPPPSPTPTPVRRLGPDTLAIALPAAPTRLDAPPALHAPVTDVDVAEQMVAHLLQARLVGIDDRGQPYPDLAERVPTLEDGGARWVGEGDARQLEVTFRLRPGLAAADAVAAWRRLLERRPGEILIERLYERVEAPDPGTLRLTFFSERSARAAAAREPNRYGFLADQRGPVVDRLYPLGLPNTWLGAGPFRLVEQAADGGLTLEARRDYHLGAPGIRRLLLRPADASAVARLGEGELDLLALERPSGPVVAALRGVRGVRVAERLGPAEERLEVNLSRPLLRDRAVRAALLTALDRRALAEAALGSRLADRQMADDEAARRYPHDPAAARQRLHTAGWAPGNDNVPSRGVERPMLRLLTTDDARRRELASLIREQLARVDVDVAVTALPAARLFDRRDGPLARGEYDLALVGAAGGVDRLADLEAWYAGVDPALDRLFQAARGELARGRQEQLEREVRARLLDELPSLPLFSYARVVAHSEQLSNVEPPVAAVPVTWNAWRWTLD